MEEVLLASGYLDEASLEKATSICKATGQDLSAALLELGLLNKDLLRHAIAVQETSESEESERKVNFLTHVIPFNSLSREELRSLALSMEWQEFRSGSIIVRQGVEGTNFYVVQTGLVKVYLREDGHETVLGFLGEGDCFGEMALMNKELTTANVEAIENTLCLAQREEAFLHMVQAYPLFYKFFSQLLFRRMKSVYKECLCESGGIGQIEPFLFRKKVTEILSPAPPFCREETPIREAATMAAGSDAGAVVVLDSAGHPKGIAGMKEMIESTLLGDKLPGDNVSSIMRREFRSVDAQSYFFDALYEMVKGRTDRLVVIQEGRAVGLISGFDLLKFRGLEMLSLLKNIDAAAAPSQLNMCRREVETVLRGLVRDGALASQACRIISELNDRIVRRVIQLAEASSGPAPCAYAWLGLGSEGRKEQTLLTDQDNALIYRGPASKTADQYFARFAEAVVNGLAEAGFPLCNGLSMATNERLRGDLEVWKRRMAQWTRSLSLEEKEMMDAFVFLDFRSNAGDWRLEAELRNYMFTLINDHTTFIRILAQNIVDVPVPLGFFKHFIVQKDGQHKHQLNIKTFGLVPLVTCVKLLAWTQGVRETNTLARISALRSKGVFSADNADFFEQAFETFLTLKIKNNLIDWEQHKEPSNYLDPALLSTRQKQLLKEAFLAVSELQKMTKATLNIVDQPLRG